MQVTCTGFSSHDNYLRVRYGPTVQNRDTRLSLSEPENDIITDAQSFRPLGSGGGGGGFFFACEDFGRIYEIHSPPAFFFFFLS